MSLVGGSDCRPLPLVLHLLHNLDEALVFEHLLELLRVFHDLRLVLKQPLCDLLVSLPHALQIIQKGLVELLRLGLCLGQDQVGVALELRVRLCFGLRGGLIERLNLLVGFAVVVQEKLLPFL